MARSRGRAAILRGALLATAAGSARVDAQSVLGGFDDASLPGRWEARLRVGTIFDGTFEQFGGVSGTAGRTRAPLGARFSFDSLGASRLPVVARTQRLLTDSLGVGIGLSLGSVSTGARTLVTRVPLQLDVGLTRRIAIGLTVPLVTARSSVNLRVNADSTRAGNLGFNPASALLSTSSVAAAARTQNARVVAQLTGAADSLAARVGSCPAAAGTGTPAYCLPVIANRAAATQLVGRARRAANGLAQVYGTGTTRPGALLVPIRGTEPQRAVNAQLTDIVAQFTGFQIANVGTPELPAAATALIANTGLQRILADPGFGVFADSVRGIARAGLGDVEVGASVMWLDTFGDRAPAAGAHVRSTIGAAYRLATGSEALAFELFDVPTGSGAALLLRSATDVALGRRFWTSVIARVESPVARTEVLRIPPFPGELLAAADRERAIEVRRGRRVEIELTPRWLPTEAFAVAGHYALRSTGDARFTGTFTSSDTIAGTPPVTYDASVLATGSGSRAQVMGFGITYSTLPAYARRRTWLPAEVSYLHTSVVAGSGGVVPRVRSDQLAVRVYTQLFGRSARRAASAPAATAPGAGRR